MPTTLLYRPVVFAPLSQRLYRSLEKPRHQRSAVCERDEPGFGGFQDADVTVPSHGVGCEVARAEALGKPVLCLHRRVAGRRLSAMLAGNPRLRCEAYESVEALKPILERFLSG